MSVVRYLYIVGPLALPGAGFGLEPGEAGLFGIAEEVLVLLVEVSGRLLQCQGVGSSEPGGFCPLPKRDLRDREVDRVHLAILGVFVFAQSKNPVVDPAAAAESPCKLDLLSLTGIYPVLERLFPLLHALLVLDVLLDDGKRCAVHGGDEVAIGPQRRDCGF